jgi:hypothetical protein
MKTLRELCFLFVMAAVLWPLPAMAQKTSSEAARSLEDEARDKAKAMEALQARYKVIDQFAGSWEGTFKVVLQGQPPQEISAPGKMETHWAFDHLWLQGETTFDLGKAGTAYSMSFVGFNPGSQQYKRIVLSTGDPREVLEPGTWDEATKTFVFQTSIVSYFTNDSFDRRDTFKVLDADQFEYRLEFIFQDKTEVRAIQGVFKRKK